MAAINQACRGKCWLTQREKETPAKAAWLPPINFHPLPRKKYPGDSFPDPYLRKGPWTGLAKLLWALLALHFLGAGEGEQAVGKPPFYWGTGKLGISDV